MRNETEEEKEVMCGVKYLNVSKELFPHNFDEPSRRVNIQCYMLCRWFHLTIAYGLKYNNLPDFMHLPKPNISPPSVPHKRCFSSSHRHHFEFELIW